MIATKEEEKMSWAKTTTSLEGWTSGQLLVAISYRSSSHRGYQTYQYEKPKHPPPLSHTPQNYPSDQRLFHSFSLCIFDLPHPVVSPTLPNISSSSSIMNGLSSATSAEANVSLSTRMRISSLTSISLLWSLVHALLCEWVRLNRFCSLGGGLETHVHLGMTLSKSCSMAARVAKSHC